MSDSARVGSSSPGLLPSLNRDDTVLSNPRLVGPGDSVVELDRRAGLSRLQGFRQVELGDGWTLPAIRDRLRATCANNDVDEAIIRRADGRFVVLYADDLPSGFRPGVRFESDQLTGEIVAVQTEIDWEDHRTRAGLYTTAAIWAVATYGLTVGSSGLAAMLGITALGGAVVVGQVGMAEKLVAERSLDTDALAGLGRERPMASPGVPQATDPFHGIKPHGR